MAQGHCHSSSDVGESGQRIVATLDFHHDDATDEGVFVFRVPDKEVHEAHLDGLEQLAIKINNVSGSITAIALNLLIILEAIEAKKSKERKHAAGQN